MAGPPHHKTLNTRLQNRVDPFGALTATHERGTLMGNRGGRLHRADQTLGAARWKSAQWISCLCAFKGRRRAVWGAGYTELFFLDEVTALAAGHRPCFECRRADALAFQATFSAGQGGAKGGALLKAPEMDAILHRERLASAGPAARQVSLSGLPDGAMVAEGAAAFALRGGRLLAWSFAGYASVIAADAGATLNLLTPPPIIAALTRGYRPIWHASAAALES